MPQSGIREKIDELIAHIARGIQIRSMYGEDHALTTSAIDHLSDNLNDILMDRPEITIGIIGDEIAFEKEPLFETSSRRQNFIDHLKTLGIKKISFMNGVQKNELMEFVNIITKRPKTADIKQEIKQRFYDSNIRHIAIGEIGLMEKKSSLPITQDRIDDLVKKNYKGSVKFLTKTFKNLKGNQRLNVDSARQIVEGLMTNLLKNKYLLLLLTSMRGHDEDVFQHGINVSIFTLLQAEMLGLEQKYLSDIGMAAILHDIGRIADPEGSKEEGEESSWEAYFTDEKERKRADEDVTGAKILLETEGIGVLPAITAFEHGMRYDMTGYPRKLYGKKLNLISMMIAISDYYDQLRRKPFYYEEGGPERAHEEMMKLSGKHFHPDLLKNFFSIIGLYPPGTLVELDTQEIALVIQASMFDIKRPQVEILYNKFGEKYDEPRIMNLMEKNKKGQFKKSIVKSIPPLEKFNIPEKYR